MSNINQKLNIKLNSKKEHEHDRVCHVNCPEES